MNAAEFLFDDADDAITNILLKNIKRKTTPRTLGSRIGRSPNIDRNFAEGHSRIVKDYLSENPVYSESLFRRRFRMSSRLFRRLSSEIPHENIFFKQRRDASGKMGASCEQAYGVSADAADEYARVSEATAMRSLKEFAKTW